ncbi:MAG TPA: two-component regulator propeller domain-containing protein, partial [Bacteroidia bacterium]|nr:two-component regulator propeller domain-containing protein [Bacteroidia bacterium]
MTRSSFFRTLSIFILAFLFAEKISAQNNWLNYTDGRTVFKMVSEGNVLWIATSGGVLRYDTITHNRTYYNRGNSPLPHDIVHGLAIDAQGNKWFGTNDGLAKFDGLHWTVWTSENSNLPYDNVYSISGLHRFAYSIYDMAFDNNGILWMAACGLVRFDGTNFTSYTTANSTIFSNTISSVAPDASGNIWLGINSGFSKFDGTTFTRYNNINYFINDVVVDPVTSLKWISTNNGVYSYNGTTFTNYNSTNSNLLTDDIRTLEIDSHSVLWIGTGYGIAKLKGNYISNYVNLNYYPFQHPAISCIHVDGAGQKWFGIYSSFIKFDGEGWNKFIYPQIPSSTVNQVTTDHQGNVWIATTAGIGKYNGTTWTVYNTSNSGLPNNNVQCLAFDNAGNMWVGLTYNGLAKFNGTTWTSYTTANSGLVYN